MGSMTEFRGSYGIDLVLCYIHEMWCVDVENTPYRHRILELTRKTFMEKTNKQNIAQG